MAPTNDEDINACNPGAGWHVFNARVLEFKLGHRWAAWAFLSPEFSTHDANEAFPRFYATYVAHSMHRHLQELRPGWTLTEADWGGRNWFILTRKKPSCAYVCTERELFRTFGIRTIRRVK